MTNASFCLKTCRFFVSFVILLAASSEKYRAQNGGEILQNDLYSGLSNKTKNSRWRKWNASEVTIVCKNMNKRFAVKYGLLRKLFYLIVRHVHEILTFKWIGVKPI